MVIKFGVSGLPVFRATNPLSRGTLKSRGGGKLSIHYCVVFTTYEWKLLFEHLFPLISSVSTEQSQICVKCSNGETCSGKTIRLIVCVHNEENTYNFDEWSCAWRKIANVPRKSGKVIITKSCKSVSYWCRIPDNGWRRTVLHDKAHWRVLTICRISDMAWVHLVKRWKIIWPERLDSREHQNWIRVGSHHQLPTW